MKVKGKLNYNYTKTGETVSLDVVDKFDNVLVKGKGYTRDDIRKGMTIYTHFSILIVVYTFFDSNDIDCLEDMQNKINYKTKDFIKL